MGQPPTKMCHTQEIIFEPLNDEWRAVDEWREDGPAGSSWGPIDQAAKCRFCCNGSDMQVDEVLVVHHEALQKVNFLLRHDELQSCESPAVPECVMAMRRAKIQKRLQDFNTKASGRLPRLESTQESLPRSEGDPSDEELPPSRSHGDFVSDAHKDTNEFQCRIHKGLSMRMLLPKEDSEHEDSKLVEQDVTLRLLHVDPPRLTLDGACTELNVPLASVEYHPDWPADVEKNSQASRSSSSFVTHSSKVVEPHLGSWEENGTGAHDSGDGTRGDIAELMKDNVGTSDDADDDEAGSAQAPTGCLYLRVPFPPADVGGAAHSGVQLLFRCSQEAREFDAWLAAAREPKNARQAPLRNML